MKPFPHLLMTALALIAPSVSLAEDPPASAHILGDLQISTATLPEASKPGYVVAPQDILDSKTIEQGGRKITIQQIKPIALSPPAQAPLDVADPAVQQRLTLATDPSAVSDIVFVGASVFHPHAGPVRTCATICLSGPGRSATLWSSADFGLLAEISAFADASGAEHGLAMAWSPLEIESLTDAADPGTIVPPLTAGAATFIITEGAPDAATLAAIQGLHDIYNRDLTRLQTARAAREQARLAQEAEFKARPPKPKDIVLNYWNVSGTAPSNKKGAAK